MKEVYEQRAEFFGNLPHVLYLGVMFEKEPNLKKYNEEVLAEIRAEIHKNLTVKRGDWPYDSHSEKSMHDLAVTLLKNGEALLESVDIGDLFSFRKMMDVSLAMRDIYSELANNEQTVEWQKHADLIGHFVVAKSYGLTGYWRAKAEGRMRISKRGSDGSTRKKRKREDILVEKIKDQGKQTAEGLKIKKKTLEHIFADLELYSAPTKTDYLKKAEETIGSPIIKIKK